MELVHWIADTIAYSLVLMFLISLFKKIRLDKMNEELARQTALKVTSLRERAINVPLTNFEEMDKILEDVKNLINDAGTSKVLNTKHMHQISEALGYIQCKRDISNHTFKQIKHN